MIASLVIGTELLVSLAAFHSQFNSFCTILHDLKISRFHTTFLFKMKISRGFLIFETNIYDLRRTRVLLYYSGREAEFVANMNRFKGNN